MLLQTLATRVALDPKDWETLLQKKYWLWSLALFVSLLLLAIAGPLLTATGSDARFGVLLAFLGILLTIHCITIDYASMRPGELLGRGCSRSGFVFGLVVTRGRLAV